jgi:hypothetical protein
MKPNPLACALLVLLAIAVQLPAQQPPTNAGGAAAAAPKIDFVPVSSSGTNAAAAIPDWAQEKTNTDARLPSFVKPAKLDPLGIESQQQVSSSGTNAAGNERPPLEADSPNGTNANADSSPVATENPNTLMAEMKPTLPDGSELKVIFYNKDEGLLWGLLFTNGFYSEVIARAEKGDPTAQVQLGFYLIESNMLIHVEGADKLIPRADVGGTNAMEKAAEAVKWFRKAADQGREDADNDLGVSRSGAARVLAQAGQGGNRGVGGRGG